MTSSISGLASGIDTKSIISQLMQIEAQPQTLLKIQLGNSQADASAYRDLNSSFAALASAAKAVTTAATWSSTKATSSSSTVTTTASVTAQPGSLSFTVKALAAAHSVVTAESSTDSFSSGTTTLTVTMADGDHQISVPSSGTSGPTFADAAAALNKSGLKLTAAAVNTGSGFRLQATSTVTGAANAFRISSTVTTTDSTGATTTSTTNPFATVTQGANAEIIVGDGSIDPTTGIARTTYSATSSTNTFDSVLTGTSFTVSQQDAVATISVASNPDATTTAVQSLVTAANAVLAKIHTATDSSTGSKAPLKGNYSLTSLTGQVLDAVSSAVGGDGSAAAAGLQLTRYGALTFDASVFQAKLSSDPSLVQRLFSGSVGPGTDNVSGTVDDTLDTDGISARLQRLAQQASDSVNGTLTGLAGGQDTRAKDLQTQIDNWTLRLTQRQATLTAQFNAMEKALGTLKNQSSWLASQISALPTWFSSSKS